METECNGMLPFLGFQLLNRSPQIETKVYVKPTNSSLLLHYQSHVDNLDGAYRLSSCWSHFSDECKRLKTAFSRLKYPNTSLTLPSKVSLTQRFVTSSDLYHQLKRRMTRFEWFYHLKTKSQQIL